MVATQLLGAYKLNYRNIFSLLKRVFFIEQSRESSVDWWNEVASIYMSQLKTPDAFRKFVTPSVPTIANGFT